MGVNNDDMRLVPTMAASAMSGALARFPCHPLDTIKARMQTQTWKQSSTTIYRNFMHGLKVTWELEGIRGLYRGFGPTVLGSIPASCLYFTTYEVCKTNLKGYFVDEGFYIHFASGMVAETVSCLLWVPIDVIKERMQIQDLPRNVSAAQLKVRHGDGFYSSGLDAMRSIIRTEGVIGFYRGYGATVMSFGPFSALYFTFYEQIKSRVETGLQYTRKPGMENFVSELPLPLFLMCGACAGAAASFFTNPLDLVKLRLQVQRQKTANSKNTGGVIMYKNMFDGLQKLFQQEGMKGMFRGVGARMAFHAPATAIGMALFEKLKAMTYKFL